MDSIEILFFYKIYGLEACLAGRQVRRPKKEADHLFERIIIVGILEYLVYVGFNYWNQNSQIKPD